MFRTAQKGNKRSSFDAYGCICSLTSVLQSLHSYFLISFAKILDVCPCIALSPLRRTFRDTSNRFVLIICLLHFSFLQHEAHVSASCRSFTLVPHLPPTAFVAQRECNLLPPAMLAVEIGVVLSFVELDLAQRARKGDSILLGPSSGLPFRALPQTASLPGRGHCHRSVGPGQTSYCA